MKSRKPIIYFLLVILHFNVVAQSDYLPIFTNPAKIMDMEGKIICELPSWYKIINDKDGQHDMGWVMGMPNLDIGNCGNIAAVNYQKDDIKLFNLKGEVVKNFYKVYHAVSPCYDGYHVAKFKKKSQYFDSDRYHYLDINGNVIFNQLGYVDASIFSEGLAAVREENKGWTFINDLGHNQNIIPDTLQKISHVGHFANGLSKVTCYGERIHKKESKNIYYINKGGEIKIDLSVLFPNDRIMRASDFMDGIASIEFIDRDSTVKYSHGNVGYINTEGKILAKYNDIDGYRPHEGGFISFMRKKNERGLTCYLISSSGENVDLPPNTDGIYHISNHFFYIRTKEEEGNYTQNIFDAKKSEIVYVMSKGNVMGVIGNLAAFNETSTERYYVVNLEDKSIVYDTEMSNRRVVGLKNYTGDYTDITNFICSGDEELDKISKMVNLKELTINSIKSLTLPDLSHLKELKVLRIDDCRNLKTLPTSLFNLSQYSIRSCTSATNLWQSLQGIKKLDKLFVLNMDISSEDQEKINQKFPSAYISGSSKAADSLIEVEVPGF